MSFPAFLLWFLKRWYFWTFVVLAVLVVSAVSWYYSDADLKAVDERAKALGVPLEWKDFPVKKTDAEQRKRLETILSQCLEVGSAYSNICVWRHDFDPIPQKMHNFYTGVDPKKIQKIMDDIEFLGVEPVFAEMNYGFFQYPEFSSSDGVLHFLQEQALIAEPQNCGIICRKMIRMSLCVKAQDFTFQNNQFHQLEMSLQTIVERLNDVATHSPQIADDLDTAAQRIENDLLPILIHEFIILRRPFWNSQVARGLGIRCPFLLQLPHIIAIRQGRGPLLHRYLDWIACFQSPKSSKDMMSAVQTLIRKERKQERENSILSFLFYPGGIEKLGGGYHFFLSFYEGIAKTALHCRLLVAEIRKSPWPSDVFSPTGAALHRVENDGRLVGAYSVGMDGIDDGGRQDNRFGKGDIYLPLYGPQFPPKSATRAEYKSAIPGGSASTARTSNLPSRAP